MSTSTGAFGLAAHNRRKSSRKVLPQHFLGSAAIAGLVLGCAWTVYTNVFGASIYPSVNSAAFEAPVVRQLERRRRAPGAAVASTRCSRRCPRSRRRCSAPETTSASIMFNERFAASGAAGRTAQAVASDAAAEAESPTGRGAEAARSAEARRKRRRPKEATPQPAQRR